MAGLRMTVGCQRLLLTTKGSEDMSVTIACVSEHRRPGTNHNYFKVPSWGPVGQAPHTHTSTTEHYREGEIVNGNDNDLQAFHLFSVPPPKLYSCIRVLFLPLECGEESNPWGHWHRAGPRPWLWSTGVCSQGDGSICISEAVMHAGVTLLCHWPPCYLELEPRRGPARLKHLMSLCTPSRAQYGEEDWERTEVKDTLREEQSSPYKRKHSGSPDWTILPAPWREGNYTKGLSLSALPHTGTVKWDALDCHHRPLKSKSAASQRSCKSQGKRSSTVRLPAVPVLLDKRWGVRLWCWWPEGLVPFKAVPSHSFLKDVPVIGKGLQCAKSLQPGTLQLRAVRVYRRNLYPRIQHWDKWCSVTTAPQEHGPCIIWSSGGQNGWDCCLYFSHKSEVELRSVSGDLLEDTGTRQCWERNPDALTPQSLSPPFQSLTQTLFQI